ncbi:MAG: hypothetical protein ACH349_01565 [Candidatus Rhabdochlamydia sp.]
MTDEINEEVPIEQVIPEVPKPKQYLIMADELTRAILGKIAPGLLFVEVEGIAVEGNDRHMLLANPIQKPE